MGLKQNCWHILTLLHGLPLPQYITFSKWHQDSPNYLVQSWNNLWPLPFFHSLYPMYQQISSVLLSEYNPNPAISSQSPPFSSLPSIFCLLDQTPSLPALPPGQWLWSHTWYTVQLQGTLSTSTSVWRCPWVVLHSDLTCFLPVYSPWTKNFKFTVKTYCCSPQNASTLPFTPIVKSAVLAKMHAESDWNHHLV